MNDDENLEENGPAAFWGGLFILALMGSCANMPYYQERDRTETHPKKIEYQAHTFTNQIPFVIRSSIVMTR